MREAKGIAAGSGTITEARARAGKERHESERDKFLRDLLRLFGRLLTLVLLLWLLLTQIFLIRQVKSLDMNPAVRYGDLVFAWRLERDYRDSDVVLYRQGGEIRIGRIVAVGGDTVEIREDGRLLVNGSLKGGDMVNGLTEPGDEIYPLTVPEGKCFILGDNREESFDSRVFGPVSRADIRGKIFTLIRHREF